MHEWVIARFESLGVVCVLYGSVSQWLTEHRQEYQPKEVARHQCLGAIMHEGRFAILDPEWVISGNASPLLGSLCTFTASVTQLLCYVVEFECNTLASTECPLGRTIGISYPLVGTNVIVLPLSEGILRIELPNETQVSVPERARLKITG